jgi:hypothetical protein
MSKFDRFIETEIYDGFRVVGILRQEIAWRSGTKPGLYLTGRKEYVYY